MLAQTTTAGIGTPGGQPIYGVFIFKKDDASAVHLR